ncbi:hypothetical protein BaRGS_00005899 [Batillaria attramentaria]|uniref:Uncharacterized protein n=1 Tax=Batillaria attramentaria TaxID=370345 RepID=A0ABD0LUN7_9CAEN
MPNSSELSLVYLLAGFNSNFSLKFRVSSLTSNEPIYNTLPRRRPALPTILQCTWRQQEEFQFFYEPDRSQTGLFGTVLSRDAFAHNLMRAWLRWFLWVFCYGDFVGGDSVCYKNVIRGFTPRMGKSTFVASPQRLNTDAGVVRQYLLPAVVQEKKREQKTDLRTVCRWTSCTIAKSRNTRNSYQGCTFKTSAQSVDGPLVQ